MTKLFLTMKLVLVSIFLLLLAVLLLGVKALFVKGGKFPSGHVADNPELVRRGMRCGNHHAGAAHHQRHDSATTNK